MENQTLENFKSPLWRLEHLYRIVDKQSKTITFRMNPIQAILNASQARRKLILKARQSGISTNECLIDLDRSIFRRNANVCIIAHEQDAVKKLFRIPTRAYRMIPGALKPEVGRGGGSRYELSFPDIGSLLYCDLESRGDTIHRLHVSEMAQVETERFIATTQAVPLNGEIILESTAYGMNNLFYDLWDDPKSNYEKFFFPWFFVPEYRQTGKDLLRTNEENEFAQTIGKRYGITLDDDQFRFRRQKRIDLKEYFAQEYPEDDKTCFLTTGLGCVNIAVITGLFEKIREPILEKNSIRIYKKAETRKTYIIGADTSEGVGRDYSVGVCFCLEDREEVGIVRGQFSPFRFAEKLVEFSKYFSTGGKIPMIAVERNNHGHAVVQELSEHIGYSNLYRHKDGHAGWLTNAANRSIVMNQLIAAVENEEMKINSPIFLQEMLNLVDNGGKIEAAKGKHDDVIIAGAIAVHLAAKNLRHVKVFDDIGSKIMV